jgi:hypothetical protein
MQPDTRPLTQVWEDGYRRVYAVRLVACLEGITGYRRYSPRWWLVLMAAANWPSIVNLSLIWAHPRWAAAHARAPLWFLGLGATAALTIVAAQAAWAFGGDRLHMVEEILEHSPQRVQVNAWLLRQMAYQSILPIFGVVAGPIFLYMVRQQLSRIVEVAPPSYIMVAWTSFLGGHVLYWLWAATGLPKQLARSTCLSLRWQDPAGTPGIRVLADAYGLSSLFLLLGVIALGGLGFLVPRTTSVGPILTLLYIFFAVSVATSLRVGLIPLCWIWQITIREKRRSLTRINARLPLPFGRQHVTASVKDWLELYQAVKDAPALPFSTVALVQYSATMVGTIVAFIIGQVAGK